MKSFLFALYVFILSSAIPAQSLHIKGGVIDEKDNTSIHYATAALYQNDTILVTGTTTDAHGHFDIVPPRAGTYTLRISLIGYEATEVHLPDLLKSTDMGTIALREATEMLNDITVTASATVSRIDRKLMYPSEQQKKASTNGMDIIRQLTMPKVQYNALSDELKASDGGELQLRINGIPVQMQEVKALRADEIVRVEYHDNPSLRYGNASVVLDYIVKRRESGGNVNLNLKNSPFSGFGTDLVSAKVNHKKSQFSMQYTFNYRDFYQLWRDNIETYHHPDGSLLQRTEDGLPGQIQILEHFAHATYNYKPTEQTTINATFRYISRGQPKMNYHSRLYNVDTPDQKLLIWDKNSSQSNRPSLDLYLEQKLRNNQTLFFNLVGSYAKETSGRNYLEQRDGQTVTDVLTNIDGNIYSLIGEAIYEKQFGAGQLSTGAKHTQSWSDNAFTGNNPYRSKMERSESYLFAEWKGKAGGLSYTGGVGLSRNWFKQEDGTGYNNYVFRPTFTLQYNFNDYQNLRLKGSTWNNSPSLTELSNAPQRIDSLQIQRGNPNLKPYTTYHATLNYEHKVGWFTGVLSGGYAYSPDAIMEEKQMEGNTFVRTYDNQRDYQALNSELTIRVSPWDSRLNVQFTNGIDHYLSNGNHYRHRYTNWYYTLSASYTLKRFILAGELFNNRNFFRGETLQGGENLHFLGVTYKHDRFSVGLHGINLFSDNYKVKSENWSALASYKQNMYINESSRMVYMTFTYNLDFGRKLQAAGQRLQNRDNSTGVGNAGK